MHTTRYVTDSRTPDATEDTNLLESTSNSMAQIAQLVERRTRHPEVVGSNPTLGEVFELRPLTQKPVVITISDQNEGELLKFERIKAGITRTFSKCVPTG